MGWSPGTPAARPYPKPWQAPPPVVADIKKSNELYKSKSFASISTIRIIYSNSSVDMKNLNKSNY